MTRNNLLTTLVLLGLHAIASGQNVVLSIGSGTGTAGGSVTIPVTVASTGGAQTTGLQWTFNFTSDITGFTVAPGASTTNAGKSLSCSGNNCLAAGFNSTVIADGTVAFATFQIAANPSSNPILIQLTNVVATTASGTSITSSGASGAVSLPGSALSLSSLNCTSATINTPGSTSCSVGLTGAAPSGGFTVALSSNNANLTVPATISVASGQTSATFTATGAQVSANQSAIVTASAGSVNLTSTLSLVAPVQLTSVACTPSTLGSSASSACTVTLSNTTSSPATISLASNNGLLTVPATVTVASGQSTGSFTATSGSVSSTQSAVLTATFSGQSKQTTISLAAAAQVSSLTCSPATVNAPGFSACTVNLTAAPSSAANVTLLSNNANITVPASVNIGAGANSAAFTATVAAVTSNQSALLTASLNGVSQSFTLSATVSASTQLTSLACGPSTLGSNASSTCTIALSNAATTAATVSLASNNGLLTVPANVTVAPGQSSATFPATSGTVNSSQSAIVTATLNGLNKQATISLAAAANLSSLSCSPATVTGPGTSTCTAALTAAASSATSVTLLSNNGSVTIPGSVSIGAGLSSANFTATVASVTSNQSVLLTASLNGVSQTFTLSAQASNKGPKSVSCSPAAMTGHKAGKCAVTLSAAATIDSLVAISSSTSLLSVPSSIVVPAGQSSAAFDAVSGDVSSSQNAVITAALGGETQQTVIALGVPVDCQEFQTSPGGLCMIQDVLPWVTFGGGWESRLNAGNLTNGSGGGPIQFSFTLRPAVPVTGGVQNHMPAIFKDSISAQTQMAETQTYTLAPGGSVLVDFLSPPAGCDANGQNCGGSPDPNTSAYGSVQVQYVADNPAYLRGIAKAQLTLLANVANADLGWQTTESEMPAANSWTAPVSVSANPSANPQGAQQASAALANPGTSPITVRGTLYDKNGVSVTFRDFQVPAQGAIAAVFSLDPNQPFGGFGPLMFPNGQDFNGLVTFQVKSPNGGAVSAMILQYVGNAVSSVEVNSQGQTVASASATRCAEFAMAADGSCSVQYTLPWVVFGGGWESRLKAGNPPSPSSGAVQMRFTLVPAVSSTNGLANHLPAYFTDNRTGQTQMGESANYTLGAGQSVDVHFLYPPAGCNSNGQLCANQADPDQLSFGSVLVQYSSFDPATLRRQANPQLAFLAHPSGEAYSSQITERALAAATTWTAPVAMSADPNTNSQNYRQASAAINNPGSAPVTVKGTLRDQNGNVVTSNDFQIPAFGATGVVFSWDPSLPFGGFGSAAFPQGKDFNGWVTFEVTTPGSSGVSVLALQYVGNTISSVNVQSLP